MNPASVMKLVTARALERLGPAFTWKTRSPAAEIRGGA
jgi:D-alanyl-D-alanine carboxypeptidase